MNGRRATKCAFRALLPFALAGTAVSSASAEDLYSFAILAGSTVTNTGTSVITGNIGLHPGSAVVGFPPGQVMAPYTIYANNAVAEQAKIDLVTAYNDFSSRPATASLTGQDLGGLVLAPGVYSFATTAQLTGTLTLDGLGNPNAQFVFQIGETLTTASNSVVALVNGTQGGNVFFIVGSSATLGTNTQFAGQILALTSITLTTDADITCGAALARNGAVTLDTNTISVCTLATVDIGTVIDDLPVGDNEDTVADVIDQIDDLPPEFEDLIGSLSPEDLVIALSQLAGQAGTAVTPAVRESVTAFLGQVSDRLVDDRSPFPAEEVPPEQPPATVRVLGYGPDDNQAQTASNVSFDGMHAVSTPIEPRWTVWGSAYGAQNTTDGDLVAGTKDRTIRAGGFAAGMDSRVMPDTKVGFAIAAGGTDFDLSDGYGGGDSTTLQAAVYGRQEIGAAYVSGILAYAWNDISTERFLTVGANERLTADFDAHDVAGQVEVGYRFALPEMLSLPGSAGATLYAGLQVQAIHVPAYSETADSGPTPFALDYDENNSTFTRTELGARFDRSLLTNHDTVLTLRSRIAWAHDEGAESVASASFQNVPNSGFTVNGAQADADSLLLSAGADLAFASGFSAGAMFDSRLAQNSQTYSATARVSYSW